MSADYKHRLRDGLRLALATLAPEEARRVLGGHLRGRLLTRQEFIQGRLSRSAIESIMACLPEE